MHDTPISKYKDDIVLNGLGDGMKCRRQQYRRVYHNMFRMNATI